VSLASQMLQILGRRSGAARIFDATTDKRMSKRLSFPVREWTGRSVSVLQ
jgi:hypothetical protein